MGSPITKDERLMTEEVFVSWFVSSCLFAVVGVTFAARDTVNSQVRQSLDLLFLSIAIFIVLWALASFLNLMSFTIHRIGLLTMVLSTVAGFCYVIYLSSQLQV